MTADSHPAGRAILFGAAGYTGRLTAEAMVRAGMAPVLAGRRRDALEALRDELAPLAPTAAATPTVAVADAAEPASVRALIEGPADVLVSTVGPFSRLGAAALDAAVDAGAGYVDSTGEPPFIRRVFEEAGPRAERSGARLLTAFGYDYVPGNLAGALAIDRARTAGLTPSRVEVGYFVEGRFAISTGTRASAAGVVLEPGFAFRRGALTTTRGGGGVREFDVRGVPRQGIAIGGSEHFALPRLDAGVADVGVYLGLGRRAARAMSAGSAVMGAIGRVPGVSSVARSGVRRVAGDATGQGPTPAQRAESRTVAQADAFDPVGRMIGSVRVEGPSPYDLTAELLAWAAAMLLTRADARAGALGPADAFGLDELVGGCSDLGLRAVT